MVPLVVKVPVFVKLGGSMLDLFSFMGNALAGRFTYRCSHFPYHSTLNVYCGTVPQFIVNVTNEGYEIKELNGTVLNKGTTFVEYTRYLKSKDQLASWMTVE